MASQQELRKIRIKKLDEIKKEVNPYPAKSKRTHSTQQALADFEQFSKDSTELTLAGRLRSIRGHGGSTFGHLEDGGGKCQIYFKKDKIGDSQYQFLIANIDIGDFVEVTGTLFLTKKGEKTLEVAEYRMLSKSLLPLPEEWFGLKDTEERFRKRYLDLLMNKDVKDKFVARSQIIKSIRKFLDERAFIEVETPILQNISGGALAQPFKTHLNALDLDLYLRIAPELYLKRLLVGGFERVYEIGRSFRNEGLDSQHNPDFTMLEFYWAYVDYEDLMKTTEDLFESILIGLGKKDLQIEYKGQKIDFKKPFKRIEFLELGKSDDEVKEKVKKIINPTFIINHPLEISPLAKQLEDDPKKVARFQLVAGGMELTNAYSELNDPQEQAKRFKDQQKDQDKGNKEAHSYDQDFVEALEYGMPPAGGFGLGIDRLTALLTDSQSLREIILFPTMKPK